MLPVSLAAQAGDITQAQAWVGISYTPVSLCFLTASEFKMAHASKGPDWWRNMTVTGLVQGKWMKRCFPMLLLIVALTGLLPIAIAV